MAENAVNGERGEGELIAEQILVELSMVELGHNVGLVSGWTAYWHSLTQF